MNLKKLLPVILIIILPIITLGIRRCNTSPTTAKKTNKSTSAQSNDYAKRGLDRNPTQINYSKLAVCRMQCRHITQKEIHGLSTRRVYPLLKYVNYKINQNGLKNSQTIQEYSTQAGGFSKLAAKFVLDANKIIFSQLPVRLT